MFSLIVIFGWAMNPLGYSDTFSDYMGYCPQDDVKRLCFVERWSRQMHVFPELIQFIHWFSAKHKNVNFVVRPHPSDSVEDFKYIFRGVPNIHVVLEGSVAPWILASSVMLHDGCTTAIESYLMGKQVVNFTPLKSEHEIFLPNLMGVRAWNQAEAEISILDAIAHNQSSVELPERAHRMFANFKNDSMRLFLDVLTEAEEMAPRSKEGLVNQLIADQIQAFTVEQIKQTARKLFFEKRYRSALAIKNLFPGFNRAHVRSRLDSIGKLTGRYLNMKWFSPWLIELSLNG